MVFSSLKIIVSFFTQSRSAENGYILLDIHFEDSTIVKYRTDVTFGFLDLMGNILVEYENFII